MRGVVILPSMADAERKRVSQRLEEICQSGSEKMRKSALGRRKEDPESCGMQRGMLQCAAGTHTEKTPEVALLVTKHGYTEHRRHFTVSYKRSCELWL